LIQKNLKKKFKKKQQEQTQVHSQNSSHVGQRTRKKVLEQPEKIIVEPVLRDRESIIKHLMERDKTMLKALEELPPDENDYILLKFSNIKVTHKMATALLDQHKDIENLATYICPEGKNYKIAIKPEGFKKFISQNRGKTRTLNWRNENLEFVIVDNLEIKK